MADMPRFACSSRRFLNSKPPRLLNLGPYTCLRTVEHRSAAMLDFHLNRLWESATTTGFNPAARSESRISLERRTTDTVTRTMEAFLSGKSWMPPCRAKSQRYPIA